MNDSVAVAQEAKPSRPVRFLPIEAGASSTPCRACGQLIYFTPKNDKTGKRSPVSMKHPGSVFPTSTTWGMGISHFADCPSAEIFRRARGAGK